MEKFKATMDMLVGKEITVNGFNNVSVEVEDATLDGVVIDGVADGVEFEVMTFSRVIMEHLRNRPKAWFPFTTTVIEKTSSAGYKYYAFGRR